MNDIYDSTDLQKIDINSSRLDGAWSIGGHFDPNADNLYDLGDGGRSWRNLFVHGIVDESGAGRIDLNQGSLFGATWDVKFSGVAFKAYRTSSVTTNGVMTVSSDVGGTDIQHAFIQTNGDWKNTNGVYGTISDRAMKIPSSIKTAPSYLERLKQIQLRKYILKNGDGSKILGVVADEFADVFPGLVSASEDGLQSVKTSVMTWINTSVLQELIARVETLETA